MMCFSFLFIFAVVLVKVTCQVEPRIVNGFEVKSLKGFEHQVSIRYAIYDQNYFGSGHMCGGSLINSKTVLTAAHCVHDGVSQYITAKTYIIAMGLLDKYVRDENTVYLSVAEVKGHKKYDPNTFEHDIALLILVSDVPENNPNVVPIALPTSSPTVGEECLISGWGTTLYDVPSSAPDQLRAARLNINSESDCNAPTSHDGGVLNGMFCAGSFTGPNIADSCQGDSGGPFTCNGIIVGITSNGVGCGFPNYPGVYIDVFHYKNWILAGGKDEDDVDDDKNDNENDDKAEVGDDDDKSSTVIANFLIIMTAAVISTWLI